MKKGFRYALLATAILLLASCSATKYVPEGSYLLDEVRIQTDNKEIKAFQASRCMSAKIRMPNGQLDKDHSCMFTNWSGAGIPHAG